MSVRKWVTPCAIVGLLATVVAPGTADAKILPYDVEVSKGTVAPGETVDVRVVLDPANFFPRPPPGLVQVFERNRRDRRGRMMGRHTNLALTQVGENEYHGTFSSDQPGDYWIAGATSTIENGVAQPEPFRVRVADPDAGTTPSSPTPWVAASVAASGMVALSGVWLRSRRRRDVRVPPPPRASRRSRS